MNKKVFKTMIALVVIFLVACYVLKIFFPEQFVMTVNNQVIISVGEYLNTHAWAFYIFGIANSFLSYWLYLCAVCKRLYLNWWQCLVVLGTIGVNIGLTHLDTNLYSAFSIISFVVLPLIFKSDLKTVAIGYSIHLFSQAITLGIRDLSMYVVLNSINLFILSIDMYLWLLLLYICFNYNKGKEGKGMSWVLPPLYGKDEHKLDKKIAKLSNKIAKLSEEKAVYEERKAKLPKKEAPKA